MREQLRRLVYRSDSLVDHNDSAGLDAIFRVSVANNKRDSITGAMALPDGKFVHVLEGAEVRLTALMERIRSDKRHHNLAILGEWPVTARLFPAWAMARPDTTPLSDQAFHIVTADGTGVQVTSILLGMTQGAHSAWL